MIGFILLVGIFILFIAFNLGNSCDISFGFVVLKQVPIFLTSLSAFILGMLCAIPGVIAIGMRRRKGKQNNADFPKPVEKKRKWGKKNGDIPEIIEELPPVDKESGRTF